jgi:small subunit ribosomal protein S9
VSEENVGPEDEKDVPSETTLEGDEANASSETPLEEDDAAATPETTATVSDDASASSGDAPEDPEPSERAAEPVAASEDDAIDEPADGVEAEEATSEEPEDEPVAEAPAPAEEPVAEEPAPAEAPAPAPAPAPAEQPAPVAGEDVVVEDETEIVEGDVEEIDVAPRQKPEIPGADLIPDIVPEGEEFLDAEAQAAAEAEAEAAAAREAEADQAETQPIADAAIDLAAGARYTATGKRKTAVARVILKPGSGTYSINGKALETSFPRDTLQRVIRQPLEAVGYDSRMDVVARMHGGGVAAQAGALRHGISRALLEADPNLRGELKRRGFLTRDPRVKERKKAGLKKARKRPQFSKR